MQLFRTFQKEHSSHHVLPKYSKTKNHKEQEYKLLLSILLIGREIVNDFFFSLQIMNSLQTWKRNGNWLTMKVKCGCSTAVSTYTMTRTGQSCKV